MTPRAIHQKRLVELLRDVNFGTRYYEYCDAHVLSEPGFSPALAAQERALANTGLAFKYDRRERFFGYREGKDNRSLRLNVTFGRHDIEFGLAFETKAGIVGAPFHLLAERVAQLEHGNEWEHSPRYPRVSFSDEQEFEQAVAFGIALYQDARTRILAEAWT